MWASVFNKYDVVFLVYLITYSGTIGNVILQSTFGITLKFF